MQLVSHSQPNSVGHKAPSVTPGPTQESFGVHSMVLTLYTQQSLEFPRRRVSGSICEGVSRLHLLSLEDLLHLWAASFHGLESWTGRKGDSCASASIPVSTS